MITLDQAQTVFSYDPETGLFTRLVGSAPNVKIGVPLKGTVNRSGYCVFNLCGKVVYAHRLAWLFTYGEWPAKSVDIDHINRDKTDNRIANLRQLSRQMNSYNRPEPKHNTSGHKGVYWDKKRELWIAKISKNRKEIVLGSFADIESAVAARRDGERVHCGGV